MKILFICESVGGGVRRHLVDIIKNLPSDQFQIHLIFSSNRADEIFKGEMVYFKEKGIILYDINEMSREIDIRKDIKSLYKIYKIAKNINPNIIHCHSSKAGALGRVIGILLKKRTFYTPHAYFAQNNMTSKRKKRFFVLLEKVLAKISYMTINVSDGEKQFALKEKIVTEQKSTVIYNGIQPIEITNNVEQKSDKFIVGTIARVDEQKNPWLFIKIAERVIEKSPNILFKYVGDGPELPKIEKYLKENNLEEKIQFLGFAKQPEYHLSEFNIYLSTSLYEGLPYSIIEAMVLKKALVLSNVTGNNELLINEYNGELFHLNDSSKAVSSILSIYYNKSKMELYGKNSYLLYQQKYSLEKMITDLKNLYLSAE